MTRATVKTTMKLAEFRSLRRGPAMLLGLGLALSGCTPGGDLAPLPAPITTSYRLGAGDQVRVITYDETQLTNTFIVGGDGTIAFPLVGTVRAEGRTSKQLASAISYELIEKNLMRSPSVSVQITQYRPISVLGEVNRPGQYPYQPGMTMLGAVALAGGFTYRAVTDYATDVRSEGVIGSDGSTTVKGTVSDDAPLEPGDVVTILERYF